MSKKVINYLATTGKKVVNKAKPYVLSMALMGLLLTSNVAFAGKGGDLFQIIVKLLGAGALITGAIFGITGGIAYAEAKAEGEGPAMAKAQNKLTAGIFLAVIGGVLIGGSTKIASLITESIEL